MSGIFSIMNTANKGLMAQQTALHTTGHNISNANTEGYSRQRVDMKADLAFNYSGVGQLGTGVKMSGIVRTVNDYTNKQIRKENGAFQQYTTKSEVLEQLEIIFNEPSDTGLNFNLGEMFVSWQELSKNPESLNSKTIVVEKSKTLADTLNHLSNQIKSLEDDTIAQIDKNILDFNATVDKLDSLNKQIFNIAIKGQVPNDLLDQRDMLLKDLSGMADIETNFDDKYGRVEIMIDGQDVLTGTSKSAMSSPDGKTILIGVEQVTIKSGQIAGNIEGLSELEKRSGELDEFAGKMAKAINDEHGDPIFDEIGKAGTIRVHDDILADNSKVMAGSTSTSPEGDGLKALDIARLRNEKLNNGLTIEGAYNDIVTNVGIIKQHSDNMVANQEVLLNQLEARREAVSGVSIDEEITNLVKFQKAYEANAKVISILTEMLDTLINRMGV